MVQLQAPVSVGDVYVERRAKFYNGFPVSYIVKRLRNGRKPHDKKILFAECEKSNGKKAALRCDRLSSNAFVRVKPPPPPGAGVVHVPVPGDGEPRTPNPFAPLPPSARVADPELA